MYSEIPLNGMTLRVLLLTMMISMPDALDACLDTLPVDLSGPDITDIPRNLTENVTSLRISHTKISVLNLTVAVEYSMLCRFQIFVSPVLTIITPSPPQTVAVTTFYLASGTFSTPPDLGIVLTRQLVQLSFVNIGIITVPENFFQNYTRLLSLNLDGNPITNLNSRNLAGLTHLRVLYLSRTSINPIPPLYLWLPNLIGLYMSYMDLKVLPGILIENLPQLRTLNIRRNQLSTVPSKEHFVNLQNMNVVLLEGNPLRCDTRLGWVKVIDRACAYKKWYMSLIVVIVFEH